MTETPPQPITHHLTLPLVIRPAVREDLPKLEWYGAYIKTRNFIRKAYAEQMQGRRLMLVADMNGFPVGQVYLQFSANNTNIADGQIRAYLYSFRVIDHLRGCGVGTLLLNAAHSLLAERGFQIVVLQVAKTNGAALRLYLRHDYHIAGEDPGVWSYIDHRGVVQEVNEPVWVMRKRLAGS